ncbi:DNA alkylation repair protein [Desulfovibrio sp.]|uniref:DNA alkylation repair protein n=1 Tax=Desulfovibrio sp. TaxID=885 RepID=UPI0025C4065D|nr:DNA alkylation repair protein [Desulfovibrio sp.]
MTTTDSHRVHLLNSGQAASSNLGEALAVDFAALMAAALPSVPAEGVAALQKMAAQGISKRMRLAADLVYATLGPDALDQVTTHTSDTVRGWGCFAQALIPGLSIEERLENMRPLADDGHFGVREWAWMALRPHITEHLEPAVAHLVQWTTDPSERVRRFACESIRPRGVWCSHMEKLKQAPALALPVLEPLHADPAVYVQDSVGNWLNDAAKSQPAWVQDVCARWLAQSPCKATARICKRAQRSIKTSSR